MNITKASMKKGLSELDLAINPVTNSLYEDDDYVLPRPPAPGTVGQTILSASPVIVAL